MGSPSVIIRDALRGVSHIGLDTAPLIYLVEKHPIHFDKMVTIVQHLTQGSIVGISSVLTLTEVLTQPLRLSKSNLVRDYENILLNSMGFRMVSIDTKIARTAADLRAHYNLKTPDAIQVATAVESGCQAFLTNDLGMKRVTELHVLVLDDLQLDP
jgi:predicted nucleic acid-binding protein